MATPQDRKCPRVIHEDEIDNREFRLVYGKSGVVIEYCLGIDAMGQKSWMPALSAEPKPNIGALIAWLVSVRRQSTAPTDCCTPQVRDYKIGRAGLSQSECPYPHSSSGNCPMCGQA